MRRSCVVTVSGRRGFPPTGLARFRPAGTSVAASGQRAAAMGAGLDDTGSRRGEDRKNAGPGPLDRAPRRWELVTDLLDAVLRVPAAVAYGLVAALVFAEAAVLVGFVLPGETAVLLGGVLAASGRLSLPTVLAVAVVATVAGDSVGYEVGRRFGPRILAARSLRRQAERLDRAQLLMRRHGGWAVFLARFAPFLRTVMPGLARRRPDAVQPIPGLQRGGGRRLGHRGDPAGILRRPFLRGRGAGAGGDRRRRPGRGSARPHRVASAATPAGAIAAVISSAASWPP